MSLDVECITKMIVVLFSNTNIETLFEIEQH